jgi:uncharacterized damage-inducible protein DinB
MSMVQALLPEFDQEMAKTRQVLEIVPAGDAAWRPHPKSFSMGDLAMHLANLPHWAFLTFTQTEYDVAEPEGAPDTERRFQSTPSLLATLDANVEQARAALAAAPDESLLVPWTLKHRGQTVFTLPRAAVFRSFVLNHVIHHRGQLTVYLRLRDVALPRLYGPTADAG